MAGRHLSCKRDQIKLRDNMKRRVTSPTWAPPLPCKQAVIKQNKSLLVHHVFFCTYRCRHFTTTTRKCPLSSFMVRTEFREEDGKRLFKDKNHFLRTFFPRILT